MIGEYKKFNKSLFQQNDPKSRRVVKEYFAKQGIVLKDNDNKFGVDLVSEDQTLQVEVEHRLIWETDEFPYEEINVPERKAKFFVDNSVSYVILSKDYSRAGMIDGKELRKHIVDDNLRESSNKYVKVGEYFYKVPKQAFKWTKL